MTCARVMGGVSPRSLYTFDFFILIFYRALEDVREGILDEVPDPPCWADGGDDPDAVLVGPDGCEHVGRTTAFHLVEQPDDGIGPYPPAVVRYLLVFYPESKLFDPVFCVHRVFHRV